MNRLLLLISLFFSSICFSQIVVKGKIYDKLSKEELIGAKCCVEITEYWSND